MASFMFERKVNLPIEKVWALIGDWTKTPGPDIKLEIENQGDSTRHAVGMIRTITIGKVCVKEILDEAKPPHSFSYRIIGGAPMKEYRGKASFEDVDGTTKILWKADIKPKIPFTGPILVKVAKGAVNGLIDSLEKHNT